MTNIDMQNLKETIDTIKKRLNNLKNQINDQDYHISTINERANTCSQDVLKLCQVVTDTVTNAEIRFNTLVNKLNNMLSCQVNDKLEALKQEMISKIAKACVHPGRTPGS